MKNKVIAYGCLTVAVLFTAAWLVAAIMLYYTLRDSGSVVYGEPYEQITSFSARKDFDKFITGSGIAAPSAEENSGEFVCGTTKTVWAEEKYMLSSANRKGRILGEEEIAELDDGFTLTVAVALTYYPLGNYYAIEAYAGWSGGTAADTTFLSEARGLDYFGLTWGGDGNIMADERSFSGTYADGNAIETARSNSDSYKGFVWMFHESSTDGYMTSSAMKIKLEREAETTGNKADLKLTYIHSFNDGIMPPQIADTSSPRTAPSLVTESLNSWQIELNIFEGLEY